MKTGMLQTASGHQRGYGIRSAIWRGVRGLASHCRVVGPRAEQAGRNPLGPYTVCLVPHRPPIPRPDWLPVPATTAALVNHLPASMPGAPCPCCL